MTVSSSISRNQYVSTGGTEYDFTFRVFRDGDLEVYVTDPAVGADSLLALGSDYTVTGAGDENGGKVDLVAAPPAGRLVTIIRSAPFVQEVDLVDNDPFHAETVEGALDRLTMLAQQLRETFGRTVGLSPTTRVLPDQLRLPEPSPGRAIGWDASGALGNLADLTGTAVSPFMETVLDDGNAAEVRADIGAETAGAAAAHAAADSAHSADKIVYDHATSGLTADRVQGAIDEAVLMAKSALPAGAVILWPGPTPPEGFLELNGSYLKATTYERLYDAIKMAYGKSGAKTFTASASTDLLTSAGHGLIEGDLVETHSSGSLPGGLFTGTKFFVRYVSANTFGLALTPGGAFIDITSVGSGLHSFYTTFRLPDTRGRFLRGWDHGAGLDPDRAGRTNRGDGTVGDYVGTLQADEFKSHTHTLHSYQGSGYGAPNTSMVMANVGGGTNMTSAGGAETRPANIYFMMAIKY